jgi:hypothetical protein
MLLTSAGSAQSRDLARCQWSAIEDISALFAKVFDRDTDGLAQERTRIALVGSIHMSASMPENPCSNPQFTVAPFISRPEGDYAGWWICCHCRSAMNPAIAPDACMICRSHYKCSRCYVYPAARPKPAPKQSCQPNLHLAP